MSSDPQHFQHLIPPSWKAQTTPKPHHSCSECQGTNRKAGRKVTARNWIHKGEKRGTLLFPGKIDHEEVLKRKGDVHYIGKLICLQKISAGCLKMNILHAKVSFERA